jgi:hypothetical protein
MHHTVCAVKMQPKLHFSQNVKACHFSTNHFSEWHAITCGQLGGTFYFRNAQKLAILAVSDQVSTCQLAKSTVQHKTQQNKTHNDATALPPNGFALSLHG